MIREETDWNYSCVKGDAFYQKWMKFCFIYFLSHTRFRWKQDASNNQGTMWALSHVYVGEKCPDMCNGRGLCNNGVCDCQSGYGTHELNVTWMNLTEKIRIMNLYFCEYSPFSWESIILVLFIISTFLSDWFWFNLKSIWMK